MVSIVKGRRVAGILLFSALVFSTGCGVQVRESGGGLPDQGASRRSVGEPPPPIPRRFPGDGRLTAKWIASQYGPLTGKAAERLAEGSPSNLEADSIRTWSVGEGREKMTVTEHLICGEPFKIVVEGRRYFDPLADVRSEEVTSMVYGFDVDGKPPHASAAPGLVLTEAEAIESLLRVIRRKSYDGSPDVAYRSYLLPTGYRGAFGQGRLCFEHGCSLGLYVHLKGGNVIRLSGHASSGHFGRRYPRESALDRDFTNLQLWPLLKRLGDARGIALPD